MMRKDTVEPVNGAVTEGRRSYVLVNNRSEGSAPLTVQALRDRVENMLTCESSFCFLSGDRREREDARYFAVTLRPRDQWRV